MDVEAITNRFSGEMVAHQTKLEGNAGDAQNAQHALESAADAIRQQRDIEKEAADTLSAHWTSSATRGFELKSQKFGKDLTTTADASSEAAKIVAEVTAALDNRHGTVGKLVEEFVTDAGQMLKAGLAVVGIAAPASLMKAIAHVADLAGGYIKESGGQLKDARAEMEEAARRLRALQKQLDADGVADEKGKDESSGKNPDKEPEKDKSSDTVDKILENARKYIGYQEGPDNQNKWGPTGQPWCSYFATSMWRDAGVDIPEEGFTGNVYKWGEQQGTAYDQDQLASQARPGDALLFGTGPGQGESTHIGIVEKVEGDKITLIEGNAGNSVQRNTYDLSTHADQFYGGVHPK